MISLRNPGTAAARSARPAGETTFGGASTSSRATLVQRPTSAARSATGAELVAGAAEHEALDAARPLTAAPATGVVVADDRALGQRADLLGDGERERRIQRPRDRPAVAAGAHRPCGSGAQPVGVGRVCHDGQRGCAGGVHHRHRIGLRHRTLRSSELRGPRRAGGDKIGADRVRGVSCHFNLHRFQSL